MLKYSFLILLFASCNTPKATEQLLKVPTNKQKELISSKIKALPDGTQFAIGLIHNGEVFYYGVKLKDQSVRAETNYNKVFEIGSITKLFTSTLLASFALENKLKLDDPISTYLGFDLNKGTRISFKQLANHTSGLPRLPSNLNPEINPENPYSTYNTSMLKEYLTSELEVSTNNGVHYEYSNIGFGMLGYSLCEIANANYEKLLQEKICSRYGMHNTTTNRKKVEKLLVRGLNAAGNETTNWDLASMVGAGGILSTVEDLAKFAIAQFDIDNKALTLTRKNTFTINHISDIGLGWEIIKRRSGDTWYKHNGGTGGYSSSIIVDTDHKNGIIILTNVSGYNPKRNSIDDLSFELMKTIPKNK